jgi:lipopolysaccharide transport system ATP-binding protein
MSDPIIRIENLSKKYTLDHLGEGQSYSTLRESMANSARSLMKRANVFGQRRGPARPMAYAAGKEDFWALKDISLEIKQGERVGIVGRNGAGKSTLLKILSRITEPTVGRVSIRGRVACLLEVGTGFHPELTGRENIFLNGAILGMSKSEIHRKFEEIVAFAEVENFLDTPVKRYSSGMYVRLAFAVAAHLEPEILIVDEVLAVGDAQFQQKCLGKMRDVAHSGRTVFFVSHNMAAVRQLCSSAVLLQKGELKAVGTADEVVNQYLNQIQQSGASSPTKSAHGVELLNFQFLDRDEHETQSLMFAEDYRLRVVLQADSSISKCAVVIRIYDNMDTLVSSLCSPEEGIEPFTLRDTTAITFDLPQFPLFPGPYRASVHVFRPNDTTAYLAIEDALRFEVHSTIIRGAMWAYEQKHGLVRLSRSGSLVYS